MVNQKLMRVSIVSTNNVPLRVKTEKNALLGPRKKQPVFVARKNQWPDYKCNESQFDNTSKWRKFSKATTIHGLLHADKENQKKENNKFRHVWPCLLLFSATLCSYQNYVNIQQYLSFNISTQILFKTSLDVNYPAITITNQNLLKKTVIGRNEEIEMMVAVMMSSGHGDLTQQIYKQINKTCHYKSDSPNWIDEKISNIDLSKLTFATPDVIYNMLSFAMVDKKMNFVKCYFNQAEIDCEILVLATLVDSTIVFSINLDLSVANNFLGNQSGLGQLNEKYAIKQVKQFNGSIDQGFTFILNVNQDEYCSYLEETWYGAGYQVSLHDPMGLPSLVFGTSINLRPGYQYNLALKPIQHIRNTANLGNCLNSFPLYMFPDSKVYVKQLCFEQCENEIVWKLCGCLSTAFVKAGKAFAEQHNLNFSDLTLGCVTGNRTCLMDLYDRGKTEGVEKACPQCIKPCVETEYDYQLTASRFPPDHLVPHYMKRLNVSSEESLVKNYLILNLFFESSLSQIIIENQMFTLRDMFIYIGSNLGLFLGMSFMTLGEVLQLLFESIHMVIKKLMKTKKSRRRMTRVQTVAIRNPSIRRRKI